MATITLQSYSLSFVANRLSGSSRARGSQHVRTLFAPFC
jgi:hypothetical protein